MQKSQKGFTLVELVVVIVLLGILGVTALGRFQDLSGDAQDAANEGIASELSAASSINFAARTLNPVAGVGVVISGAAENCATAGGFVDNLFASGTRPAGYNWVGTGNCGAVAAFNCTVDSAGSATDTLATATILCTP